MKAGISVKTEFSRIEEDSDNMETSPCTFP